MVALAAGGVFFSGYIYLFHLHGVFYSPALLYLEVLLALSSRVPAPRCLIVLLPLALVTAMYHPFALLLFAAFAGGLILEQSGRLSRRQLGWTLVGIAGVAVLIVLSAPGTGLRIDAFSLNALVTSYRTVELNALVSLAALALTLLAVFGTPWTWRVRAAAALACAVTAALLRRWSAVALVLTSSLFPIVTATGSPTYTVVVLMACTAVTALGADTLERRLGFVNGKSALALAAAVVAIVVVLRAGVTLPVVSDLVQPVLAEQEKTYQLQSVVAWLLASPYHDHRPVLCEKAYDPSISTNAMDRRYRPPTQQWHLDNYMAAREPGPPVAGRPDVLECFGGGQVPGAEVISALPGKYSGAAIVYVP